MSADAHAGDYPPAALVTGAARRIGAAVARDLAACGWAVGVHYNTSRGEAEKVVEAIAAAGGRATALPAELGDEAALAEVLPRAAAALGPIGLLVNNAAIFEPDDPATATRASWERHMAANLRAPFVLTQALARGLPAGRDGVVVNLLDARVFNLSPGFTSYTVSKSGLWTLTRTLALELAPRIRVNAVGPGPALPSPRQSRRDFEAQCARTPLGIATDPAEICAAVRFILAARAMTGQMIALDGGQHLGWALPGMDAPPVE